MSDIFLSYSRVDEEFAHRLAGDLDRVGAQVWLDVASIPAGMKWSTAVQQGLDTCKIMLVIISPDSMQSRNVEDEWHSYLDDGKTVIPILWRPARIHFQLRRIQYVDFHEQDYSVAFDHLRAELQRNGILLEELPADAQQRPPITPVQAAEPTTWDAPSHPPTYSHPPGQSHTPLPSYGPPTPQPGPAPTPLPFAPGVSLLSQATATFRSGNWAVKSDTGNSAVVECWSYGSAQQRRTTNWILYGLSIVFGLLGGVVAGFIASRSFRKYTVQLNMNPDGTVATYGDLGQYTLSNAGEITTLAGYVVPEKRPMNGLAPWVIALGVGLVSSYCWYSVALSMATPTYYY